MRTAGTQELRREEAEREEIERRDGTQGQAMTAGRRLRIGLLLGSVLCVVVLLCATVAATAQAASAHWEVLARSAPSTLLPGKKGFITAVVINLGDTAALGEADPVVITDTLPAGIVALGPMKAEADTGVAGQLRPKLTLQRTPRTALHVVRQGPVVHIP